MHAAGSLLKELKYDKKYGEWNIYKDTWSINKTLEKIVQKSRLTKFNLCRNQSDSEKCKHLCPFRPSKLKAFP